MKHDIYNHRSKLKNTGISITEHLTDENQQLVRDAREVIGFVNVWTSQNKILANLEGTVHTIKCPNDIVLLRENCKKSFPEGLPDGYKAERKTRGYNSDRPGPRSYMNRQQPIQPNRTPYQNNQMPPGPQQQLNPQQMNANNPSFFQNQSSAPPNSQGGYPALGQFQLNRRNPR